MKRGALLEMLAGGDRRSIGRSNEVAAEVLANPPLFAELVRGMQSGDPLLRMRAADAAEKVTVHNPGLLQPHRKQILNTIARIPQQEIRRHVAQFFSRISWTRAERAVVLSVLREYLEDKSSIVRTTAMQALADQAERDRSIRAGIVKQLKALTESGTPAMQARGRKLLARLEQLTTRPSASEANRRKSGRISTS